MTAERYGHPFPWRFADPCATIDLCPKCTRFRDEFIVPAYAKSRRAYRGIRNSITSADVSRRRAAKAKRDADEPR